MKKIALILSVVVLFFVGCEDDKKVENKEATTITSGKVSQNITIGKKIKPIKLKDQFDKNGTFSQDTKTLIFVFKKATGHTVNEFMKRQKDSFVKDNGLKIIADVSKMPSLIKKFFAIPDLQKSNYPILLIEDEELSKKYQNHQHVEEIMIVTLDKLVVKKVTFLSNEKQLKTVLH